MRAILVSAADAPTWIGAISTAVGVLAAILGGLYARTQFSLAAAGAAPAAGEIGWVAKGGGPLR